MAVTRQDAVVYIGGIYSQLLIDAGMTATDNAANLKPVIDSSLRTLGIYDDLDSAEVSNADAADYESFLNYFGYIRIINAIINRVDFSMGDPNTSARRSQQVTAMQKQLELLKEDAISHGLSIGSTWQSAVSINLDYLEPAL